MRCNAKYPPAWLSQFAHPDTGRENRLSVLCDSAVSSRYKVMSTSAIPGTRNLDKIKQYILRELPRALEQDPQFVVFIEGIVSAKFPRRDEFARLLDEVKQLREDTNRRFEAMLEEMNQRFEQVDRRFEQVDHRFEQVDHRFEQVDQRFDRLEARVEAGFQELQRAIDRLGARWGIRNESLFRQTIAALLEQSFGAQVTQRQIEGEQFDVVIVDGQHLLVEIAASAGPDIQERMERKRRLYTAAVGMAPARMILATAAIHSRRAEALRAAGVEVIEPEEETT